ncbi:MULTISPECIES: aspartate/glutamate racemase family protein [Clostridia]|uniref:aspartate/glutamate racemase family protein n=1 Tax=Clostridia TaxID=186801 RepID=UPI000EA17A81|nr:MULTISPECIES: aspartate/glutamate racemase family protein [Clostridia]NBJ68133.1 hydantoin racemase [Roseburia sp. 1XD42-34]RKI81908.1 hydantoin racemase [Clostridium sp. 1xD42-85]
MLGIIRVLTTKDNQVLEEHGSRLTELYGIESKSSCIASQPNGIYDDESEKTAIPKIVALAQEMAEDEEIEAITISCAADPGLKEARQAVDIPVFGAGICGAHAASMVGSKVAVVGITEQPPPAMKKQLGETFYNYAFSPRLRKTTDLFQQYAKPELLRVIHKAIEAGADVILFACTGFSTIRLKAYLQKHLEVPVIDLVEAQGIAYQLFRKEQSE